MAMLHDKSTKKQSSKKRGGKKRSGKTRGKQALAQRGAALTEVREASPRRVDAMLMEMERRGEIIWDVYPSTDDVLDDELDENVEDGEIDFNDEDDFPTDGELQSIETCVLGSGDWMGDAVSPFETGDFYEISIRQRGDGGFECNPPENSWGAAIGCSSAARDALDELSTRHADLARIAEWLTTRQSFLRAGDIWNYFEGAYENAKTGYPMATQKDLVTLLDLKCDDSSFSRFVKRFSLVWVNGYTPLLSFFDKKARRAWVARAFREMCDSSGLNCKEEIDRCGLVVVKKGKVFPPAGDLDTFSVLDSVEFFCKLVKVKWADVVQEFGEKMEGNVCDE